MSADIGRTRQGPLPDVRVFATTTHSDNRGSFRELVRPGELGAAIGRPFPVRQLSRSESKAGVLRGIHLTDVPPGQAKYVTCLAGRAWDVAVDLRMGSPTFGRHQAVTLDGADGRAVFIPEGFGHGYLALEDDTIVLYLHSEEYRPELDRGISALDTDLAIDWPVGGDRPIRSPKDEYAPTLAETLAAGSLPRYEACCPVETPGPPDREAP